jgi:hypothetical protein
MPQGIHTKLFRVAISVLACICHTLYFGCAAKLRPTRLNKLLMGGMCIQEVVVINLSMRIDTRRVLQCGLYALSSVVHYQCVKHF